MTDVDIVCVTLPAKAAAPTKVISINYQYKDITPW